MNNVVSRRLRRGFTLVELTVVILIIGIVATIAAPRFFDSVGSAKNKSAASTTEVLRNAIELFRANNSAYPGADGLEATLKTDLAQYLRKDFPTCQVGKTNASIFFGTTTPLAVDPNSAAWIYNKTTGEIRINHADYISY